MDAGVVDLDAKTVSATVEGFSVFVLLQRLFPGSTEDVTAPRATSLLVQDEATGTFGMTTSIDVSDTWKRVTFRFAGTDDISGIGTWPPARTYFWYQGPTNAQLQVFCGPRTPVSGSDTNGEWDCTGFWQRYAEDGTWTASVLWVEDNVGNWRRYSADGSGNLCDPDGACIAAPTVEVTSVPDDIEPPQVTEVLVSLDEMPRVPSTEVTVNVA
ncbi:MAG: hypothetical protein ACE5F5_13440, partial [Acidimicrobiia bacterium]